jgi:methyl coenzyme M reductase subunit C
MDMGRLRTLVALALVLAMFDCTFAAKGGGRRHAHAQRGTVATVSADSMVVKVRQGKDKNAAPVEKTFQLSGDTQVEFMSMSRKGKGEKPDIKTTPATLSDLKPGEVVRVATGDGSTVKKVSIIQRGKRGKKNNS